MYVTVEQYYSRDFYYKTPVGHVKVSKCLDWCTQTGCCDSGMCSAYAEVVGSRHLSYTLCLLKVGFSNRRDQFSDFVCYRAEKSLVTHNARSTFSNPWATEQLGGKNDQVGVVVICADNRLGAMYMCIAPSHLQDRIYKAWIHI